MLRSVLDWDMALQLPKSSRAAKELAASVHAFCSSSHARKLYQSCLQIQEELFLSSFFFLFFSFLFLLFLFSNLYISLFYILYTLFIFLHIYSISYLFIISILYLFYIVFLLCPFQAFCRAPRSLKAVGSCPHVFGFSRIRAGHLSEMRKGWGFELCLLFLSLLYVSISIYSPSL